MAIPREILIWLAGLISTDGGIYSSNGKFGRNGIQYCVFSSELDWLEMVKSKLENIGLKISIYKKTKNPTSFSPENYYHLQILNARYLTKLFREYNISEWMMPRKRSKLDGWYLDSKPDNYLQRFSAEEDQIILSSYKSVGIYGIKLCIESKKNLAKLLGRNEVAIGIRARRLLKGK